jgi:hypothetical protein
MKNHVSVQFSTGEFRTMTMRQLCGWARQHDARVRTDDGWPVHNGKILTLGTESLATGVVRSHNETLATWQTLAQDQPDPQAQRHAQYRAEQAWAVLS